MELENEAITRIGRRKMKGDLTAPGRKQTMSTSMAMGEKDAVFWEFFPGLESEN